MGLADLLFPKNCLSCGREGGYICITCIRKVQSPQLVCPECRHPSVDGFTHVKCKKALGLEGVLSLWNYQGVVRKAILKLKYAYAREIATELSEYAAIQLERFAVSLPKEPILIPVPLYFLKENSRGFNQTKLLGETIVKKQKWEFVPDLLLRKQFKKSQTDLNREERVKNVSGVFAINPKYKPTSPMDTKTLIVFDDVYTTGSTLKEVTKVLKRNGAKAVWGLTIAR